MAAAAPKKITAFNDRFEPIQADEWFANALERLLTFHPGPAGPVDKTTLIELIRTVLPGIVLNSYHRDAEWASWNAANAANDAESSRLSAEMGRIENELQKKKNIRKALETLGKPIPAALHTEIRNLEEQSRRVPSLLMGAEGPMARIADRKDLRRKTLRRRQAPFITQIKAVIDHSTLLTSAEKDEAVLFVDGLIPYFKKKYEHITGMNGNIRYTLSGSSNAYGGLSTAFTDQVRTLDPSVTGSENVSRGIANLTANTRAAATAVSHVPGLERFNSLVNDIMINPIAQSSNEDVINLISLMTPAMLNRIEERARDETKRLALVARLRALRGNVVPKAEGDKGFDQLTNLIKRLKRLKETRRNDGATGGAGNGSKGGGHRKRRTHRRMRRTRR